MSAVLRVLVLPENVREIGLSAFYGCQNLKSVSIPVSMEVIGADAFTGCGNLTLVAYGGSAEMWQSISIDSTNEVLSGLSSSVTVQFSE